MTESPTEVRAEAFDATGPVELDVRCTLGRIDVTLTESDGVSVELRPDPDARTPWAEGLAGVLDWVSDRFGDQLSADLRGDPAEAIRRTTVEKVGNRVAVHGPNPLPLRNFPLSIAITAPAGSRLEVKAGAANVTLTGTAGRLDVTTGSGDVTTEAIDGPVSVRTGSGAITLGTVPQGFQAKTGGGQVRAATVGGSVSVITGTGGVRLGAVSADVMARSGSGDLVVTDAASGTLELTTGSGQIRVGVRPGVDAEVELSANAGRVTSELDVAEQAPDREVPLRIRARTGSGDATVTRAAG